LLSAAATRRVAASVMADAKGHVAHELSREEILELVELFGAAAERAQRAGFDGLEVMAARGYLLSTFLSAAYNQRTDDMGGSVENRARFLGWVLRELKRRLGKDYPVWCRIDGEEWNMERGISIAESRQIAFLAQEAGADAIHVFGGDKVPAHATLLRIKDELLFPSEHPDGFLLSLAAEIKKAVRIPVIGVGRITPRLAEESIRNGIVDLVAVGRGLIADPDLPNKAKEGRLDEIIPCIVCLRCRDHIVDGKGMRCSVNPATGREGAMVVTPTHAPKRVVVVGGGPAGLQAAITAARRGHQVTLVERGRRLGGSMLMAGIVNPAIRPFVRYQVNQVRMLPIEVKLSKEVTTSYIGQEKPDAVVLALGGSPCEGDIRGMHGQNVLSGPSVLSALNMNRVPDNVSRAHRVLWRLASWLVKYVYRPGWINWGLKFGFPFRKEVVIVGGGFAGLEIADVLSEKGKRVTVLEQGTELGYGLGVSYLWMFMERLKKNRVAMEKDVKIIEITDKGVEATVAGERRFFTAGTVLLAIPLQATRSTLQAELQTRGKVVHTIGDATDPGKIFEAVDAGARVALQI